MPAKRRRGFQTLDEIISKGSVDATGVARRVCEDIRGDILRLSRDLNVHSSAADRAKVERQIKSRIARLNGELSKVMDSSLKLATENANRDTGEPVKFSAAYTREILAMVQESQGENLASVFSRKMSQSIIESLRKATVSTIQEAALSGLSLREQKNLLREKWEDAVKGLGEAKFIDSGGREWEARDYFTMSVRTNSMRVYNDVLAGNITNNGDDLAQISRHGDPHCSGCFPWEGRIISLTGKTKGFPTYEDAREAGCFHPNCTHVLQTVDEIADAEEIELQRGFKSPDSGDDPMKVAFDLDVKRKQVHDGMSKEEAEDSVRRDRLTAAIRTGIPREGKASAIVKGLSDTEVRALTDGAHVPRFTEARKHEKARFTPGSAGGHVVMPRGKITTDALKEVPGVGDKIEKVAKKEEPRQVQTGAPKTLAHLADRQVTAEQEIRKAIERDGYLTLNYEQLEAKAKRVIERAVANGAPGMYIPTDNLIGALREGFKTQFETNTSQGAFNPESRIETADSLFGGDARKLGLAEHEKYGALIDKSMERDFGNKGNWAQQYAYDEQKDDPGACVRFRADRVLATFTMDDSLDSVMGRGSDGFAAPRLDSPRLSGFGGAGTYHLRTLQDLDTGSIRKDAGATEITKMMKVSYIELQYHGDLKADCVESINFRSRDSAERFFTPSPAERLMGRESIRDIVAKHGIKVFVNGKPFEPEM